MENATVYCSATRIGIAGGLILQRFVKFCLMENHHSSYDWMTFGLRGLNSNSQYGLIHPQISPITHACPGGRRQGKKDLKSAKSAPSADKMFS